MRKNFENNSDTKPYIQKYLDEQKANGKSWHLLIATRSILTKLDNFKLLDNITKEDLINYFSNFKGKPATKKMAQVVIKKYFSDKPELSNWIKPVNVKNDLKSDDILNPEDIDKLINATNGIYWKAYIAFAFESGARFSEIQALSYKDFKETDQGMVVEIHTTKTGAGYRKMVLPFSAQYIRNLITYEPSKPEAKMFRMTESYVLKELKEIAEAAKIDKPMSPHRLRHAQATDMCKRGYNETIIKKKLGWSLSGNMIARYTHPADDAVINATLEKGGDLPSTAKHKEITTAPVLTVYDQSAIISNLNDKIAEMEDQHKKDMEDTKET